MRLTKRDRKLYALENNGKEHWVDFVNVSNRDDADEKLCQLEDIEDELGIDLITLFKALKEQQSIYYVYGDIIVEFKCFCNEYFYYYKDIDFKHKSLNVYTGICHLEKSLYFKDYGITWALDKNDLTSE